MSYMDLDSCLFIRFDLGNCPEAYAKRDEMERRLYGLQVFLNWAMYE
jgi:hypothetical protein